MESGGLSRLLLTVIVPHYNNPIGLRRLLQSVPNWKDIEVIVVDDCSNKYLNEYDELKKGCNSNVLFYSNAVNGGAGAARNVALLKAKGKYVLFADSDDFFNAGAFETIKTYIINDDNDIIFFPPTSIYESIGTKAHRHDVYEAIIKMNNEENPSRKSRLILRYSWFSPCSKLIRRSMIMDNNICFDEVEVSNDVMFSLKCGYYAGTLRCADETIYTITCAAGSLTRKKDFNRLCVRTDVFIKKYTFLREKLSEEDLFLLNIGGYSYILRALLDGYGVKNMWVIGNKLRQSNVPIFKRQPLYKTIYEIARIIYKNIKEKLILLRIKKG